MDADLVKRFDRADDSVPIDAVIELSSSFVDAIGGELRSIAARDGGFKLRERFFEVRPHFALWQLAELRARKHQLRLSCLMLRVRLRHGDRRISRGCHKNCAKRFYDHPNCFQIYQRTLWIFANHHSFLCAAQLLAASLLRRTPAFSKL